MLYSKKQQGTTFTNQKNIPQIKKFKDTQSIQPEPTWSIVSEFNKQLLENLKFDCDLEIEDLYLYI